MEMFLDEGETFTKIQCKFVGKCFTPKINSETTARYYLKSFSRM